MNMGLNSNNGDGTSGRGPIGFQIGLATFGILALELALIRFTSSQIRVFAYFNNLVLIGAFLGMGLGVALGRRHARLVDWTLPALLVLCVPLSFSEELGIMRLSFPDPTVFMWGAEEWRTGAEYLFHLVVFLGLFGLVVLVFVLAGSAVGARFGRLPALGAYTWDLGGSLCGVVAFTGLTFFHCGPPAWLALGGLPFLWLSRKWAGLGALAGIVALSAYSIKGATYSAYNRIDVVGDSGSLRLEVNRDFHQLMHDLSDRALAAGGVGPREQAERERNRAVYDLPFRVNDRRGSALIVGAGTGNDAQAALRAGYGKVWAVDIDGRILELGRRLHPEHPYDDPRVRLVEDDARAFFEQYQGPPFDVICYGLVDSHAMFSSMSTLRLDNYMYTVEGLRAAWRHVSPQGHLSVSFSTYAGDWIADRMYWTIVAATGREPVVFNHGMHWGTTYLVAPDINVLHLERVGTFPRWFPVETEESVRIPHDDWPFLYVRPGVFPWGYVLVLAGVMALAGVSVPRAFGRGTLGRDFDWTLFLMGAAFLLIETRGVTSLSLLFGSTWIVNSAIFAGTLIMVLAANLLVERRGWRDPVPWFIGLFVSTAFLWFFNPAELNQWSMLARGLAGGLINALPIGFAGVVVSIQLGHSRDPSASLGSNLLGSVLGGCLEYLSMALGLKMLALLALAFYLLALLHYLRGQRMGPAGTDAV
jgi:SAM-dependent methyltransferase